MSRLYGVSSGAQVAEKLTCRFTERRMHEEEKTEMTFEEIVDDDSTKKVAALAFVCPLSPQMALLTISTIA
jgi:hypothetical protein